MYIDIEAQMCTSVLNVLIPETFTFFKKFNKVNESKINAK